MCGDRHRVGSSEAFDYDTRHRLVEAERGVLNTGGTGIEPADRLVHAVLPGLQAWSNLDSRGNWLGYAETLNGTATQGAHSVNAVNEVETVDDDLFDGLPAVSLQYDANGNLIWDDSAPNAGAPAAPPGQRYVYDPSNRLTKVWRTNGTATTGDDQLLVNFRYDALGRRIATEEYVDPADGLVLAAPKVTWHIYDGFSPIVEYDVTGIGSGPITRTQAREFVWGAAFPEPVVMIDHTDAGDKPASGTTGGGPEPLYYLTDALGSVVALADSNGQVVERYEYDAYGAPHISDVDAAGASVAASYRTYSRYVNPFAWTAQRWDPTTRLYHFYARSYSPHLGRWVQRDPLKYIDGVSLYQYGMGSPIFWTDPYGLWGRDLNILGTNQLAEDARARNDAIAARLRSQGGKENQINAANLSASTDLLLAGHYSAEAAVTQQALATTVATGAAVVTGGAAGAALSTYIAGTVTTAEATIAISITEGSIGGGIYGGVEAAFSGESVPEGFALGFAVGNATGFAAGVAGAGVSSALRNTADDLVGTKVYRVYGDDARALGKSWTTVDPSTVANYRNLAGLPSGNSGRFVIEGTINDAAGISTKSALQIGDNIGGLPEVVIPNPSTQITVTGVAGCNPPL